MGIQMVGCDEEGEGSVGGGLDVTIDKRSFIYDVTY